MLLKFFKGPHPINAIFIVLIAIGMRAGLWFVEAHSIAIPSGGSFFGDAILEAVNQNLLLSAALSLLIVLAGAFYFNQIIHKRELLDGFNYMPALFYILLMTARPSLLFFTPQVAMTVFLLPALDKILKLSVSHTSGTLVFDSAFFIGLATMFYTPAVSLLFTLFLAMLLFDAGRFKNWIYALIGFVLPFLLIDGFAYVFADNFQSNAVSILQHLSAYDYHILTNPGRGDLLFLATLLWALAAYIKKAGSGTSRERKSYSLLAWSTLVSIAAIPVQQGAETGFAIIAAFAAFIFTVFHLNVSRWFWSDISFLALLSAIILNYL